MDSWADKGEPIWKPYEPPTRKSDEVASTKTDPRVSRSAPESPYLFIRERVKAGQCGTESQSYSFRVGSEEDEYFKKHTAAVLKEAVALTRHPVARSFVTPDLEIVL